MKDKQKHSLFFYENLSDIEAYNLNPQSLAFVGDAVYSLFIRANFSSVATAKSGTLHKQSTQYVKATAQAKTLENILPVLSEREALLVKRARNTKVNMPAKHASLAEYMQSTAYEALLGFLYLSGQRERLDEILNLAIKNINE